MSIMIGNSLRSERETTSLRLKNNDLPHEREKQASILPLLPSKAIRNKTLSESSAQNIRCVQISRYNKVSCSSTGVKLLCARSEYDAIKCMRKLL